MLVKDVFLLFYTRRLANVKLMDFPEDKPTEPACKEGQLSYVTKYILDRATLEACEKKLPRNQYCTMIAVPSMYEIPKLEDQ